MPDRPERPAPSGAPSGAPSPWVSRFLPAAPSGEPSDDPSDTQVEAGPVLDLAAGGGRHTVLARSRGWPVVAVDRKTEALEALDDPRVTVVEADLEVGDPQQVLTEIAAGRAFAAIIVANYLHRPLLPLLPALLAPDGRLIYETFMDGNAAYCKPSNPDFLLRRDELLETVAPHLSIAAFEQGFVDKPTPRMLQRLTAFNGAPVLPD